MDNKKPEAKINPVVMMGNMAFQLSDILDIENKPEVKAAIDGWITKKQKAPHGASLFDLCHLGQIPRPKIPQRIHG